MKRKTVARFTDVTRRVRWLGLIAGLVLMPGYGTPPARAQGNDAELRARLTGILERDGYSVFSSDTVLRSKGTVEGDVIFLDANGSIDAPLRGDVVILGGELGLRSGASVEGDLLLLRGSLFQSRNASHEGEVFSTQSNETVSWFRERMKHTGVDRGLPLQLEFRTNRMGGFALDGYDRVDGFSLSWGFSLVDPELDDFRLLRARVVTATTRHAIGFDSELRLPLGTNTRYSFGIGARSRTDTHDRWRLGDLENAVKAFVAGKDIRYYHRREGYSLDFRARPGLYTDFRLAFQDEHYYSLDNMSPFTLFGSDEFHANMPVSGGRIRSMIFSAEIDTRSDPFFGTGGLWGRLETEMAGGGLGGDQAFTRFDVDFKKWYSFVARHYLYGRVKWAWADKLLPFQRGYSLGNTMRAFDEFAFVGDRMLLVQGLYGYGIPTPPVLEYVFFQMRLEAAYEAGTAFFKGRAGEGYDELGSGLGIGFSGETLLGRLGIHLFQDLGVSFRSGGRRAAVSLQMNVFD